MLSVEARWPCTVNIYCQLVSTLTRLRLWDWVAAVRMLVYTASINSVGEQQPLAHHRVVRNVEHKGVHAWHHSWPMAAAVTSLTSWLSSCSMTLDTLYVVTV